MQAATFDLIAAGIILAVCVFIPRGFCGYVCPLGTLIDCFDWIVGKRVTSFTKPHLAPPAEVAPE